MFNMLLMSMFVLGMTLVVMMLIAPWLTVFGGHDDKPVTKYVIPVRDKTKANQAYAISHAEILLDSQGVPPANITVIVMDKGIGLLKAGNRLSPRVMRLIDSGVQVHVCQKSLAAGRPGAKHLIGGISYVADGEAYLEALIEGGYYNHFTQ